MTTPIPENRTTSDKVETSVGALGFFDGVPIGSTRDTLIDFVDRGRAVEAFINMTPAASMYSLRQGHRDEGLTKSDQTSSEGGPLAALTRGSGSATAAPSFAGISGRPAPRD
jgi:hypothetical protein